MASRPVAHPSADSLKAFGLGNMDDTSAEAVLSHLEVCPDCRNRVAALSGDQFLDRLRQAHARASTPAPKALPEAAGSVLPGLSSLPGPPLAELPLELVDHPQYEVLRELGRGGMGVVYLARHCLSGRQEVLKVMNQALLTRAGSRERFLREIQAAAALDHPNVVKMYTALEFGQLMVLVMEYVEGEDLGQRVQIGGPLPVVHACYYTQQAALGLQHAFERGMVHRDIKPQNLILSRAGKKHVIKVLDFGLAKATREKGEDRRLTGVGLMIGTPDYVAPEQTLDAATADIRADLYSLGCTLYYLLTANPPFRAKSLYEVLQAHQAVQARPLNLARPDVPVELAAVVAKLMAKDPAKRYQTPAELALALTPFLKPGTRRAPAGPRPALMLEDAARNAPGVGAKVEPAPPARVPAATAAEKPEPRVAEERSPFAWDTLTESSTPPVESQAGLGSCERGAPAAKTASENKWRIGAAVATCVLLLGLAGLWASGVLKVKTPDGILVVEVNEPNPDVYVDGKQQVTVTWANGGKKAEIRVKPGTHMVEVKKDGFTVRGKSIEIIEVKDGERHMLTATLSPSPPMTGNGDGARIPASEKKWIREVGALPADKQVGAVAAKLKERNPGFDGQLKPKMENGALVELSFPTDAVEDISPLRALPSLQRLYLRTESAQGKLTDLTPLHGLLLTHLSVFGCRRLHDLTPLQGMKLVWLDAARCPQLQDLTPLQGMPLTWLDLGACPQLQNLAPLQGMPLTWLSLSGCGQVRNLTPLRGMSLTWLNLWGCGQVRDLTPLRGMPLAGLDLWGCGQVRDLTPLRGMPLTRLDLAHCKQVSDPSPLQGMKLTCLNLNDCAWVRDLGFLQGMKLTRLDICACGRLQDLTPLRGMPLTWLDIGGCGQVQDLTPLQGMPLRWLGLRGCDQVRDLTPLQGMQLEFVNFAPKNITKGIETIRRMKSLQKIGLHWDERQNLPPEEFWKRYDAGEFGPLPAPAQAQVQPPQFTNSLGMKLVLIPAGTFRMGSPEDEQDREGDEGPQHEVEITRPFYLGKYHVTCGQFRAFVRDTDYRTEAEKAGEEYTWKNPG